MQVNQLNSQLMNVSSAINERSKPVGQEVLENKKDFGNYLTDAIKQVNDLQVKSDQTTTAFAEGKPVDLHQVMIDGQKASISLQAAMEIRNKAVEAYQEIMRMQV